jgi:hypothetical protein
VVVSPLEVVVLLPAKNRSKKGKLLLKKIKRSPDERD